MKSATNCLEQTSFGFYSHPWEAKYRNLCSTCSVLLEVGQDGKLITTKNVWSNKANQT